MNTQKAVFANSLFCVATGIFALHRASDRPQRLFESILRSFFHLDGLSSGICLCGFALFRRDHPAIRRRKTDDQEENTLYTSKEREYHRHGLGRALFAQARKAAAQEGYTFLQVKTVKMGVYEDCDAANRFYLSLGFAEFEALEELWGRENPCQIYVMSLR